MWNIEGLPFWMFTCQERRVQSCYPFQSHMMQIFVCGKFKSRVETGKQGQTQQIQSFCKALLTHSTPRMLTLDHTELTRDSDTQWLALHDTGHSIQRASPHPRQSLEKQLFTLPPEIWLLILPNLNSNGVIGMQVVSVHGATFTLLCTRHFSFHLTPKTPFFDPKTTWVASWRS